MRAMPMRRYGRHGYINCVMRVATWIVSALASNVTVTVTSKRVGLAVGATLT
jgi:hypothetical protein